jgi:hypothetical protein
MNIRIGSLMVLALTLMMSGLAMADDKEKGASVLEDEMIAANKVMKTLRTQIADPSKNASSLQMIEQMQKARVRGRSSWRIIARRWCC